METNYPGSALASLKGEITYIHLFLTVFLVPRGDWSHVPALVFFFFLSDSVDEELLHPWCDFVFPRLQYGALRPTEKQRQRRSQLWVNRVVEALRRWSMARYSGLSVPRDAAPAHDALLKWPRIHFCLPWVPLWPAAGNLWSNIIIVMTLMRKNINPHHIHIKVRLIKILLHWKVSPPRNLKTHAALGLTTDLGIRWLAL